MRHCLVALVLTVMIVACGGEPSQPGDTRTPEQRVEAALSSTAIPFVESNLRLIPKGTPGRDKVVAHLADLNAARAQAETQEHERQKRASQTALAKLRKERDDIKNVTYYHDKNTPREVNSRSEMYLYFIEQGGRPVTLRLVIQYVAEDWLFIERFYIKADNHTFTIEPASQFAVERDNGEGKIWEWFDAVVDSDDYRMLQALIASKSATLRYQGKQYYMDRALSPAERQRLGNVLTAFEAMGGKV